MTDVSARRHLSEQIKIETRAVMGACRRAAIDDIFQKCQGLKSTSGITSDEHEDFIAEMTFQGGNVVRDWQ
eukprot:2470351-Pyramimonas_sp.AAC.1